MQYLGHILTLKQYSLFIWSSKLTKCPDLAMLLSMLLCPYFTSFYHTPTFLFKKWGGRGKDNGKNKVFYSSSRASKYYFPTIITFFQHMDHPHLTQNRLYVRQGGVSVLFCMSYLFALCISNLGQMWVHMVQFSPKAQSGWKPFCLFMALHCPQNNIINAYTNA